MHDNEKVEVKVFLDAGLFNRFAELRKEVAAKFPIEETFEYWLEEDMTKIIFEHLREKHG